MSLGNDIVVFLPKDFGQYCIEVIVRVNKSSGEEFINEHFKRLLETIEYPNSGKKILSEQEAGKLLKQVIIHLGLKSEVFLFMLNGMKYLTPQCIEAFQISLAILHFNLKKRTVPY